jgi:hypothetical protein
MVLAGSQIMHLEINSKLEEILHSCPVASGHYLKQLQQLHRLGSLYSSERIVCNRKQGKNNADRLLISCYLSVSQWGGDEIL